MYSANPPSASQPVNVENGHRFSCPARHQRHAPHVSRNHAIPTVSPMATLRTPSPSSVTMPTTWCPGTTPARWTGSSLSTTCRSVRHSPHASTFTSSSPRAGVGTGRSTGCTDPGSGPVAHALIRAPGPGVSRLLVGRVDDEDRALRVLRAGRTHRAAQPSHEYPLSAPPEAPHLRPFPFVVAPRPHRSP